ncbi:MAG: hypothetical protein V7K50_17125 [Nostoc sp.]|uniref:hypothetical protein n=1 Tax=Nostoc sp. TaxID=1180 RepID=UPI002FF4A03E
MTRPRILQPGQSYKFSKYLELPYAPADILAELGCSYERASLQLPQYLGVVDYLEFLQRYLRRNIMRLNPISEPAKREVLIAPILLEICDQTQTKLNKESSSNCSYFVGNLRPNTN